MRPIISLNLQFTVSYCGDSHRDTLQSFSARSEKKYEILLKRKNVLTTFKDCLSYRIGSYDMANDGVGYKVGGPEAFKLKGQSGR